MDDNRVFIGKIPQSVTEAEIRAYFAQFGEIEHVQCPFSTKPFKISFVTYTDADARDKAIAFSGHNLHNSPLNVVKASPKPQKTFQAAAGFGQEQAEARVFVGHIPEDVTEEMLQTHFSTFGTLLKCFKPAQGSRSTGKSDPPGYAFVTFSDHKEKHLCLAQEAHTVGGHTLRVMEAKPKPAPGGFGGAPAYGGYGGGFAGSYNPYGMPATGAGGFVGHGMDETDPKRVFISHMQPAINDPSLRAHFSQFGTITDVFIPQPQPTDSTPEDPKGFAYVSFEDSQAVYRTLAMQEHIIQGARIDVQEARPKSSRRQSAPVRGGGGGRQEPRVFIGKIPTHITDDIITTHFSQFGEVKEFYRPREQHARDGMAFGFLTYTSIPDLARCLAVPQHALSDGTMISVTRARPRPSAGGGAAGAGDMSSFGGAQQIPQMFGQQAYGAAQQYAATAAQGQQYAPAVPQAVGQQQFPAQGQYAAPAQSYAMNQGAYAGQLQQAAAMPQGYGATQPQRTNQRYNPY